jgi:hypothetical protein
MDISRAFSFVTEDQEWITKILVGGIILLIPIAGPILLLGYMMRLAEQVSLDHARSLPTWSNFGDLFMKGLYHFVITLVYLLPAFIILGIFICITALGASAVTVDSNTVDSSSSNAAGAMIGGLSCIVMPLYILLALAGGLLAQVGIARYILAGQLSAAFDVAAVVSQLRAQPGLWLLVILVGILSSLVASVGLIACGVGVLFTSFYAYCVQGHALGQIVRSMRPGMSDAPAAPTIAL